MIVTALVFWGKLNYFYNNIKKMNKSLLFLFCLLLLEQVLFAQKVTVHAVPSNFVIEKDEVKFAGLINHYRSTKGLGELQVSPSLCFVAKTHLKDVTKNNPSKKGCSLYSWSDKGNWKPCCFKNNMVNLDQMSAKPSEVVGFRGKGFEIMISSIENKSMVDLLDFWLKKKTTGDFLLSNGKWDSKSWQSMGVGIYKGYASIWLSEIPDRFATKPTKNDLKKNAVTDEVKGDIKNDKTVVGEINNKKLNTAKISHADSVRRKHEVISNSLDVAHKTDESISSKSKIESANFKNYYLVHSTYTNIKEALKTMEFLKKTGIKRLILLDSKGEYRVVLGVYPEKELAEAAIAKLKFRFSNLSVFTF
jgi:hypothetical protein